MTDRALAARGKAVPFAAGPRKLGQWVNSGQVGHFWQGSAAEYLFPGQLLAAVNVRPSQPQYGWTSRKQRRVADTQRPSRALQPCPSQMPEAHSDSLSQRSPSAFMPASAGCQL